MITTNAGTEITTTENKVAGKRQFINDLQIEVEMIAESANDTEIKQKLSELAKKIRFSDPMSDDSLSELENEILNKVTALENSSSKAADLKEIETLLLKRNKKTKTLKRQYIWLIYEPKLLLRSGAILLKQSERGVNWA